MAHGDAVGHGDGAEFPRRAARRRHALLDHLSLAHQRDVAGSSLVPARGDAHKRLVDLLPGQTHGIVVGTMRSALRPLGYVPAWQIVLGESLRVHIAQIPSALAFFPLGADRQLKNRSSPQARRRPAAHSLRSSPPAKVEGEPRVDPRWRGAASIASLGSASYAGFEAECRGIVEQIWTWCIKTHRVAKLPPAIPLNPRTIRRCPRGS